MNTAILHPETRSELPKEIFGFKIMVSNAILKNEVIIATKNESFKLILAPSQNSHDIKRPI